MSMAGEYVTNASLFGRFFDRLFLNDAWAFQLNVAVDQ